MYEIRVSTFTGNCDGADCEKGYTHKVVTTSDEFDYGKTVFVGCIEHAAMAFVGLDAEVNRVSMASKKHEWKRYGDGWACADCGLYCDTPAILSPAQKVCTGEQVQ